MVVASKLREDPIYFSAYVVWSKLIFLEALPYTTIIVLNALICRQLWQSYRFRKSFQPPAHHRKYQQQLREERARAAAVAKAAKASAAESAAAASAVGEAGRRRIAQSDSNLHRIGLGGEVKF